MDTRPSGLMGEFGDYFDVIDSTVEVVSSSDDWDYDALNQLSCRPGVLDCRSGFLAGGNLCFVLSK